MIISNKFGKILFISRYYPGKFHDLTLLHQEFTPALNWFEGIRLSVDSGFQGLLNDYSCEELRIPIKKRKGKKGTLTTLTNDEKKYNKIQAKQRVIIEHVIGKMKRYRVLVDRNRLKLTPTLNTILGVCAALWNFYIAN